MIGLVGSYNDFGKFVEVTIEFNLLYVWILEFEGEVAVLDDSIDFKSECLVISVDYSSFFNLNLNGELFWLTGRCLVGSMKVMSSNRKSWDDSYWRMVWLMLNWCNLFLLLFVWLLMLLLLLLLLDWFLCSVVLLDIVSSLLDLSKVLLIS